MFAQHFTLKRGYLSILPLGERQCKPEMISSGPFQTIGTMNRGTPTVVAADAAHRRIDVDPQLSVGRRQLLNVPRFLLREDCPGLNVPFEGG